MSDKNVVLRERLRKQLGSFDSLDSILFTSFGFDAAFFERNILPAALNLDPNRNPEISKTAVNERLLHTSCAVLYDATLPVAEAGEYRYQAKPIHWPTGFFHAKLVVAAGYKADSQPYLFIMCSSANLTYSAWASNEEAHGFIWLNGKNSQPYSALSEFLKKIKNKNGTKIEAINRLLSFMEKMSERDTEQKSYYNPKLYISSIYHDGFPVFFSKTNRYWDHLVVYSPYWGREIREKAESFKAKETWFRPALHHDLESYGVPIDELENLDKEIYNFEKPPSSSDRQDDNYRFRHAKVYSVEHETKARLAVGSCNFTGAGLGTPLQNNLEAMIVYHFDFPAGGRNKTYKIFRNMIPDCESLDLDALRKADKAIKEEEAPEKLPFVLEVIYNWKSNRYSINWESKKGVNLISLELPGMKEKLRRLPESEKDHFEPDATPDKRIFIVKFSYAEKILSHTSIIFEEELDYSKRKYIQPLTANEILQCWKLGDQHTKSIINRKAANNSVDDTDGLKDTGNNDVVLDLYNIYQSFLELTTRLEGEANKAILLVRGPHSVRALVEQIADNSDNLLLDYLILYEVKRIFERFGSELVYLRSQMMELFESKKRSIIENYHKIDGQDTEQYLKFVEENLDQAWRI